MLSLSHIHGGVVHISDAGHSAVWTQGDGTTENSQIVDTLEQLDQQAVAAICRVSVLLDHRCLDRDTAVAAVNAVTLLALSSRPIVRIVSKDVLDNTLCNRVIDFAKRVSESRESASLPRSAKLQFVLEAGCADLSEETLTHLFDNNVILSPRVTDFGEDACDGPKLTDRIRNVRDFAEQGVYCIPTLCVDRNSIERTTKIIGDILRASLYCGFDILQPVDVPSELKCGKADPVPPEEAEWLSFLINIHDNFYEYDRHFRYAVDTAWSLRYGGWCQDWGAPSHLKFYINSDGVTHCYNSSPDLGRVVATVEKIYPDDVNLNFDYQDVGELLESCRSTACGSCELLKICGGVDARDLLDGFSEWSRLACAQRAALIIYFGKMKSYNASVLATTSKL